MEKKTKGKYVDRLQILKDNRAETCDNNTDSENNMCDKLINQCAEIANDLHKIKTRLEAEIQTYKGYCDGYNNKQSPEYNYWLGQKSQAESTFNMLKKL